MGKIKNPISLSKEFGINKTILKKIGVLDVFLNADTNLFIDPMLLAESSHKEISDEAYQAYKKHFETVIKLLSASRRVNDVPWRNAARMFKFHEISWTCLGYGGTNRGSGFGPELTLSTISTAKEIVDLGVVDVDLFMAMALFEEGIGPDRISDMTTNIILTQLLKFNRRVLDAIGLKGKNFEINGTFYNLLRNPYSTRREPILLVPTDILRDLPIASDWSDISRVVHENEELRNKVNARVGEIWATMSKKDKSRLKSGALKNKRSFETLLELIKEAPRDHYDFVRDRNGEVFWSELIDSISNKFPFDLRNFAGKQLNIDQVYDMVGKIIDQFKSLIEDKGLWKELWDGKGQSRKEKSAQRLFFAVAESYCKSNNLDLTPEADTGNGPVDFKVSIGFDSKVLVEIKLSNNPKIVHGYEKQLEIYKKSEETARAYYLIVDISDKVNKKIEQVFALKNNKMNLKLPYSEVVVVDGTPKESASKRA